MAVFKCKMCGGTLEVEENAKVCECEFCGTKQTLPSENDEQVQGLYNRANVLRMKGEFDKAGEIYEKIATVRTKDPEVYWGMVLCKYGIEYVEDPASFKRVPTCHRASYDAVTADEDYKAAIANADISQQAIYEAEAKAIEEIQKGIIAISQNEKPYDVFICYKETDDAGQRTVDSAIANDIYHQLTQEGFKVFYAAITLEDKLGQEYEPYIFAALNSAKVMLAIGTRPEYFNAVWVKNEWSRYLKIMSKDRSKLLIPCYRDMDPYELPEEFAHLQAQDMSKIGFINDVVRGIKKVIVPEEKKEENKEIVVGGGNANTAALLKRAFIFLEDGNWKDADEYCEKVLDQDPENAEAYLGKLMAEQRAKKKTLLKECSQPYDYSGNYAKVVRFGSEELKAELDGYIKHIKDRNEKARKNEIYTEAVNLARDNSVEAYETAIKKLREIRGYKDTDNLITKYQEKIKGIKVEEARKSEEERIAAERKAEEERIAAEREAEEKRLAKELKKKKTKKALAIVIPALVVIVAAILVVTQVVIPNSKKLENINLEAGAIGTFGEYGGEPVEWRVLDKDGNKVLIITDKIIDAKPYNDEWSGITWENCSLRKWLNEEFISTAFTEKEKEAVLETNIKNEDNQGYGTNGGKNTKDKVFLLSIEEVEKYFSSDNDRQSEGTKYAKTTALCVDNCGYSWWWLRSPGRDASDAATVLSGGGVYAPGDMVYHDVYGIRPALWIDTSKLK
ncbi:MAG: toll/interleukin-1 receptor domain-containing protein [Firmicutes bacterium]|nr:toll/interleukin-1 receptor domain-containing protein [Bacillota bacterium]